ncbi:MAG: hypothetical protein WDN47_05475 [Candidatus Doudnabacteria bacterium]
MIHKIFIAAVLFVFIASPATAAGGGLASLKLVPDSNKINIVADSGDQPINAVAAIINYDPAKVNIRGLDFTQSFCQLFIEKNIDTQKGQIRILCGKSNPGLLGSGIVGSIRLAKAYPNAQFKFDAKTQVLANDGLGTNVLGTTQGIDLSKIK